jgi:hypothetical protein
MLEKSGPTAAHTVGEAHDGLGFRRQGIKEGWEWGIRVNPIRTPPRYDVAPVANPLAPLLAGVDGSTVTGSSTPPLAPPLSVLLRCRSPSSITATQRLGPAVKS